MDNESLQSFNVPGSNFGFTGMQVDNIGALDQTLYTLLVDESGSTLHFRGEMEACTKEVVRSLRDSPRADNLMFRLAHFSTGMREIHGFKSLQECNVGDYSNLFGGTGRTDLFDSTLEIAEVTRAYAEKLAEQHYQSNGILVVMTDGCDYGSLHGTNDVGKSFERLVQEEKLESAVSILIGVNITEQFVEDRLKEFKDEAGFTQFVSVADASKKTLAKIANFISQSVSSQSQALGTGGASQSLTF